MDLVRYEPPVALVEIEHIAQQPLLVPQVLFGLFAARDVAHQGQHQPFSAHLDGRRSNLDGKRCAVLAVVNPLETYRWLAGGGRARHGEIGCHEFSIEVGNGHRQQFLASVPQALARPPVDVPDLPLHIPEKEAVAGVLDQAAEALLAFAEFLRSHAHQLLDLRGASRQQHEISDQQARGQQSADQNRQWFPRCLPAEVDVHGIEFQGPATVGNIEIGRERLAVLGRTAGLRRRLQVGLGAVQGRQTNGDQFFIALRRRVVNIGIDPQRMENIHRLFRD